MEKMEGTKVMDNELYKAAMKGDSTILTSVAVTGDERTETKANILHIAIRHDRYDFIKTALGKFPHLVCQSNLDNNTPFHIGAKMGNTRILELLVNCYNKAALEGLVPWRVKNSEGNTPLHVALICAKLQFAENLVMIDPELTAFVNDSGETPLHLAVRYQVSDGDRESVLDAMKLIVTSSPRGISKVESLPKESSEHTTTLLLEKKPSVACIRDSDGLTPLLRAALFKTPDISTIESILNYCPQSIEVCDSSGKTFFHLLSEHSHRDDSKDLLCIQETINSLKNHQDFEGNTPAHLAVKNRNIFMLRFLFGVSADFAIKNKENVSAADLLQQQSEEFHNLQLNNQGKNSLIPWTRIEEEDEKLQNLLSKSHQRGIIDTERRRNNWHGGNVLHDLIYTLWFNEVNGKRPLEDDDVQEFIKQALDGSPVLICETNEVGETPLHQIAKLFPDFIDQSVLRMVCYYFKRFQDEYGVEGLYLPPWRMKDKDGNTPLHIALMRCAPLRCFREFVELDGGLLEYQNDEMQTPLHLLSPPDLSSTSFEEVTDIRWCEGADLYDKDGLTPLLKAAREANIPLVKLLYLLNPSSVGYKTKNDQKTFWHLLASETHFDSRDNRETSLELLLEIRCDGNALKYLVEADHDGNTPLHIAIEKRNFQFARFIMEIAPQDSFENIMRKRNGKDLTPIDLIGSAECFENFIWSKHELMTHLLGARSLSGVPTAMVKDSTNTIGVIAALLATITFTAAFTVPGGLNTDNGIPLLMRKAAFQVFMVSDILAMCLSMMILFCLLWTMGNQRERVVILDLAIFLLELSFYATLLAFMTGLYVTTFHVAAWVAIFACAICSLLILLMRQRVVTSAIRPIINIAFVSGKAASSVKEFLYLLLCCVPKREMIRCSQQPNEIQKLKLKRHEHELVKTWRASYRCNGCQELVSSNWSFNCNKCNLDLHPECALKNHKKDDMPSWIPKRIMTCCSKQPKETNQGGHSSPTHGDAHAERGAPPSPMWRATVIHSMLGQLIVILIYNLHPKCALKNNEKAELGEGSKVKATDEEGKARAKDDESKADTKEDSICEGDV
ncbi:hypothetical protein Cgig2_033673 [Carnegiea gigantea]|uniref:PGG domain-containing protein n=1 Tax=Carnegiea gigantea TaxID=171969 RepID=A0A9Q1JKW4_9CARY|nr:hypothetical protein Cgig2_033673 [Carnegiea gigantea]